jgi:hypothetical protein
VSSNDVFGFWLRRPVAKPSPPLEITKRIKTYLTRCESQSVAIGIGSAGKDTVQLKFDISEIFRAMIHAKPANFLVGRTVLMVELLRRAFVAHFFDKQIIALSKDVTRLYCETSVADIALPADGMIFVKKTGNRAWPNCSGAPKCVCRHLCRN